LSDSWKFVNEKLKLTAISYKLYAIRIEYKGINYNNG
jgi:hypothetical protein